MHVAIVGAGLAGLSAADVLNRAGVRITVLEAGDEVGGRVRTDTVEGLRLDRGFQILLPAYPEVASRVDLAALDPRPLRRGAFVAHGGRRDLLADPRGGPAAWQGALHQTVLGAKDLAALGALTVRDWLAPADLLRRAVDRTTRADLARRGLSQDAIERVMLPFLAGVFLEPELTTSSRFFHLVWRCFARGGAVLPADGMVALPRQFAARLPAGALRLNSAVEEVLPDGVRLAGGERVTADAVVVATDGDTAHRLVPACPAPRWHGVTTWYFRPPESPLRDPALVVDADSGPLVNALALPGPVVQGSTVDFEATESDVRAHLGRLFRADAAGWDLLARYPIPRALPAMAAPHPMRRRTRFGERLHVCGDHRDTSSIQGALVSGRRVAEALLAG
ncbi:NAD(P)/FAD-dependent oxidoreductase [Actinokineospora guangxiensis]|uniref:NAD(P)/FAD-dependent oxidoreductase n=1 Tax=Actinokineospora guangxiensis TaxID=1490288 RepID=A0ABW0ELK0_9PSEU